MVPKWGYYFSRITAGNYALKSQIGDLRHLAFNLFARASGRSGDRPEQPL